MPRCHPFPVGVIIHLVATGPIPPKASFREIASAEKDFASLCRSFVAGFDPSQRGFVIKVCSTWASCWVNSVVPPPPGVGLEAIETEVLRSHNRRYYLERRDEILRRQRLNYQRRRRKAAAKNGEQPAQRRRQVWNRTTDA